MKTASRSRNLLVTTGLALLLSACSAGAATAPPTAAPTAASTAGVSIQPSIPATDPASAAADAATDAPAEGGGTTADACTIVTHDDVATATGFAIATTSGTAGICYYQNADPSQYLVVQLFGSRADMASMTEIEPGSEHIDGLGDDAFWAAVGGILFVRKGDHAAEFVDTGFSFGSGSTAARDAMVTLARTALPKL
jgi:hypothetical protein